jgi:hypothetical protein
MTVGRIGELTALTTGATTRMVDRLEQAGFVRRVADPADRRRVGVELAPERAAPVLHAYDPVEGAARAALDVMDDAMLGALHGYLVSCVDAYRAGPPGAAGAVGGTDGGTATTGGAGAPIASATAGRLVFVTGAPSVRIEGAPDLGAELYRARFSGAIPSARVRDGVVTIRYPRFAWFDWRARVGDQWLNASAHWRRDTTELALNASLLVRGAARRGNGGGIRPPDRAPGVIHPRRWRGLGDPGLGGPPASCRCGSQGASATSSSRARATSPSSCR